MNLSCGGAFVVSTIVGVHIEHVRTYAYGTHVRAYTYAPNVCECLYVRLYVHIRTHSYVKEISCS